MVICCLRGKKQFERVAREGKRFGHGFIQLRILANWLTTNRIGVVIPVKSVRLAVDRNRIRRLVKESVRALPETFSGYDIVAMVRFKPETDHMHYVRDYILKLLQPIMPDLESKKRRDLI